MDQVRILAFAGSARKDSVNKKALKVVVEGAQEAGADVTVIDLADYSIPLYNGDLEREKGLPEDVKKLKILMNDHEGFIVASPEYNSSITPLLKNVIDWTSRPQNKEEVSLSCYKDKVAVLVSASPGALGGLRALREVRSILSSIGVIVLPGQYAVSKAFEVFSEDGDTKDKDQEQKLKGLGKNLVLTLSKLMA